MDVSLVIFLQEILIPWKILGFMGRAYFPSISYNSLQNNKTLDLSKLKAFADDRSNVTQNLKFVSGRVENIVEKEKILVTSIFSFSYNVFKSFPSQDC